MTENEAHSKKAFDNPAYKILSRLNGKINDMTKEKLIEQLQLLHLNTKGDKSVLKKRLKSYHKRQLIPSDITPKQIKRHQESLYEYFVVIDFEATCEKENVPKYVHEIIEFPAVLISYATQEIIDEFHSYVKPIKKSKLSNFCIELTGITQEIIDDAPIFTDVLINFEEWLVKHELGTKNHRFAIVTDGPWDMSRFMYQQCRVSHLKLPRWSRKWINLRKCFCNAYDQSKTSLGKMLESFSIPFEGRPHSGICDSRNIAKVLVQMLKDGCNLLINERMYNRKIDATNNALNKRNLKKRKFLPVSKRELFESYKEESDDDDCNEDDEEEDDDCNEDEENENGDYDDAVENNDRDNLASNLSSNFNSDNSSASNLNNKLDDFTDDCSDLLLYLSLRKT